MMALFPVKCQRRARLCGTNGKQRGWNVSWGLVPTGAADLSSRVDPVWGCILFGPNCIIFDRLENFTLKSRFHAFLEKARCGKIINNNNNNQALFFSTAIYIAAGGQLGQPGQPREVVEVVHCTKAPGRGRTWRLTPDPAVCPAKAPEAGEAGRIDHPDTPCCLTAS